ncbi:hypothetical protein [Parasediminibacterium sp. JCM 36343]|uniref:hypothetical protein n=1 Tax=Parasediminibacterium sp. JCM 36343 TaxID=3374279 RepID=UPI0039784068
MAVLGISANSRVVGIAVIREGSLLDCNVHYYKEQWSETKAARILGCLKRYHRLHPITKAAIAIPHEHHQNKETKALIALIQGHCLQKGIPLSACQPEAFDYLHQKAKAKKKAMMLRLTEHYPELIPLHWKELRNKRRYYFKLFEAVAVARLLSQQGNGNHAIE